jgi:hypothetical protein
VRLCERQTHETAEGKKMLHVCRKGAFWPIVVVNGEVAPQGHCIAVACDSDTQRLDESVKSSLRARARAFFPLAMQLQS